MTTYLRVCVHLDRNYVNNLTYGREIFRKKGAVKKETHLVFHIFSISFMVFEITEIQAKAEEFLMLCTA